MTDLETITRLLTPCTRCGVAAPDLEGVYPELCRPCTFSQRAEVADLLHHADSEAYWGTKPLTDLLAAARCFAVFGSDNDGYITDPRTGYIHNPED